jgi:hypothetical protein
MLSSESALPELAAVHWRPRVSKRSLTRAGVLWTATTVAQTVPLSAMAAFLALLSPFTVPFALLVLAHAWGIPELYAARGARVLVPAKRRGAAAERRALGLLGDLLDHRARELYGESRLAIERGTLGVWLIGEAGAVLVRRGGHRVYCYCVQTNDADLPAGDRLAHLLLALRADEAGFATVANLVFCGARWRLRHRLPAPARAALDVAWATARASERGAARGLEWSSAGASAGG